MTLSKETLARMSDESRFPTDEVSAMVYKVLLQHCVEMDHLDGMLKKFEAGVELDPDKEIATVNEGQRQVHLEFVKRFPNFKYASELSYEFDQEKDEPRIIAVKIDGHPGEFKQRHDLVRDDLIHRVMEQIFKYHTQVFENGEYEFCWEFTGREHDVTYKYQADDGHMVH